MPILSRALLLSVHAAALVATVGQTPLVAFAAPVPAPLPLPPHLPDYASQPPSRNNTTITPYAQDIAVGQPGKGVAVVNHTMPNTSPMVRRQNFASITALLQAWQSSDAFFASSNNGDLGITQLMECLQNYNAMLLSDAGADKGLANYDPQNPLEMILKDLVNFIKYSLNCVVQRSNGLDNSVLKLSVLKLDLAQVLDIIKCIIDLVLDTIENLTDETINKGPLVEELQGLFKQSQNIQCSLSVPVLGLCL